MTTQKLPQKLWVAAALGLLALPGTYARAQNNAQLQTPAAITAPVSAADKTDFETTLAALSQKYQTAIIAESAPLHPTLSKEANAKLQAALAAPDANKKADLAAAASAFDYEPVFVNAQTVLLLKKYSDPQDLPEITPGEAALFLDALLTETAPFLPPPNTSQDHLVRNLFANATPSEIAAYANGVPWSQMPLAFQSNFASYEMGLPLLISSYSLKKIRRRLQAAFQTERIIFKIMTYRGSEYIVYDGPFLPGGRSAPVVLSDEDSEGWLMQESHAGTSKTLSTKAATQESTSPAVLSCAKTLAQIAQEINDLPEQSNGGVCADIATAFQQKTVCVFGTERLSPLAEIKAVAQVFGLRGVQGGDKLLRVVPPSPRLLQSASEIADEVSRLMPAPLLRALRGPDSVHFFGTSTYQQAQMRRGERMDALWREAGTRLRQITAPQIAATPTHEISLASLPVEARMLVALSNLMSDSYSLQTLENKDPFFTPNDFTRAIFKASRNGSRFTYEIHVMLSDGQTEGKSAGASFGGTPTPEN